MTKSSVKGRAERKSRAEERKKESDTRTPEEQLARLDSMFGEGRGARKERLRLELLIKERNEKQELKQKRIRDQKRREKIEAERANHFDNKPFVGHFPEEQEEEKQRRRNRRKNRNKQKKNKNRNNY